MQDNVCANYKLSSRSRQKVQSSAVEIQNRIQQCDDRSKRKPSHRTRGCLHNERTVMDYQLLNLDKILFTNHLFRIWILSNVDINNNFIRSCAYRIIIFYDPVHMVQQSACWFLLSSHTEHIETHHHADSFGVVASAALCARFQWFNMNRI